MPGNARTAAMSTEKAQALIGFCTRSASVIVLSGKTSMQPTPMRAAPIQRTAI